MDKSWMDLNNRMLPAYINGVNAFLEYAFLKSARGNSIRCPCYKCVNCFFHSRDVVFEHLMINGIVKAYKWWSCHGEEQVNEDDLDDASEEDENNNDDDMHGLLGDLSTAYGMNEGVRLDDDNPSPNEAARKFYDLLDAEKELYPGCKEFSKFQFMVTLLELKSSSGWTDKSFTALLKILKRVIPSSESLPDSFYEANNYIKELGMRCNKIDACKNDCILYWGEYAQHQSCPICNTSRWQSSTDENVDSHIASRRRSKNIPHKVLRHFPLIPRLQRLYMSSKMAEDMRWHKEKRLDESKLRHPADAFAWKSFDRKHPTFSSDSHNIRLGLASDGFNPFGIMSTDYSVWPVVLVPYNVPPWLCMKVPRFLISLYP